MNFIMISQETELFTKDQLTYFDSEKPFQLMVNIWRWLFSCLLQNALAYIVQERYPVLETVIVIAL